MGVVSSNVTTWMTFDSTNTARMMCDLRMVNVRHSSAPRSTPWRHPNTRWVSATPRNGRIKNSNTVPIRGTAERAKTREVVLALELPCLGVEVVEGERREHVAVSPRRNQLHRQNKRGRYGRHGARSAAQKSGCPVGNIERIQRPVRDRAGESVRDQSSPCSKVAPTTSCGLYGGTEYRLSVAISERSLGWLRYLHRKAHTADNWDRGGSPHPHWDDRSDPPMASWHRFDLVDSSYAMGLMAHRTPAWTEPYVAILDQLIERHTSWWSAATG